MIRRRWHLVRRRTRRNLSILPAAAAALMLGACSPVRLVESVDLLAGIAGAASAGQTREDDAATRTTLRYEGQGRTRRADLYVPPGRAEAALVLVPGAAQRGWRDPRMIAFAHALADAGFAVLVPRLPGTEPLQVSVADADAIADAALHLSEIAQVPELGMAAVSYAVGPTVLAALRPAVADEIRFVFAIGGYHDIMAAITYLTTGAYRPDAGSPWRFEPVFRSAKWLFLRANAGRVGPPDAAVLRRIAEFKLHDPDASVTSLAARLGPDGRAVHRLLSNGDPDRVPDLFAALPRDLRQQIMALDLSRRDLGRLEAGLILVHGRNDPMVPYTQSIELAGAVPPEQATVYLVDDLRHVDLGVPALDDALTLVAAAYRLLTERDALPRPSLRFRPDTGTIGTAAPDSGG